MKTGEAGDGVPPAIRADQRGSPAPSLGWTGRDDPPAAATIRSWVRGPGPRTTKAICGLGEELQGHGSAEPGVLGLVDDAHAAAAELGEHAVVGDGLPDHDGPYLRDNVRRRSLTITKGNE